MAGGLAFTLQTNRATDPSLTTTGEGCITKDEIPGRRDRKKETLLKDSKVYNIFILRSVNSL